MGSRNGGNRNGARRGLAACAAALALAFLATPSAAAGDAYVANEGSDNVSQYDVGAQGGGLSPKNPPAVGAGTGPLGVAMGPAGVSVYVADFVNRVVSQYDVSRAVSWRRRTRRR
jgi:DNA-binding beta-propeller fold protein YncE